MQVSHLDSVSSIAQSIAVSNRALKGLPVLDFICHLLMADIATCNAIVSMPRLSFSMSIHGMRTIALFFRINALPSSVLGISRVVGFALYYFAFANKTQVIRALGISSIPICASLVLIAIVLMRQSRH